MKELISITIEAVERKSYTLKNQEQSMKNALLNTHMTEQI